MIFENGLNETPACSTCHAVAQGQRIMRFDIGPGLYHLTERAETRIEGVAAADYIRESITSPGRFIVPGFRGAMYAYYGSHLSEQDVDDLVAYLLTL